MCVQHLSSSLLLFHLKKTSTKWSTCFFFSNPTPKFSSWAIWEKHTFTSQFWLSELVTNPTSGDPPVPNSGGPSHLMGSRIWQFLCSLASSFDERLKTLAFSPPKSCDHLWIGTNTISDENQNILFELHFSHQTFYQKMSLSHPSQKTHQPSSIFFNDHTKSLERRRLHSKRLRNSTPNLA